MSAGGHNAQDRRSNYCRYVADAASIRVNAGSVGSVGYDSYCCAGPYLARTAVRHFLAGMKCSKCLTDGRVENK